MRKFVLIIGLMFILAIPCISYTIIGDEEGHELKIDDLGNAMIQLSSTSAISLPTGTTFYITPSQVSDLKNVIDISNSGLQTYYINISSISIASVSATGKDIEFSVIGTGNCTFNLNGGSNIYLSDDFSRAFNSENWGKGINETLTINITELEAGATVQASIIYKK